MYLAGILASKLIVFFIKTYYDEAHDAFPQIKVGQLKQLPIRTIDFDDPVDTARHDRMVQLVEQMLALHKELPEATTGHEQDLIRRRIDATDRQIDTLVYELYELTPEDIEIVEKSVR